MSPADPRWAGRLRSLPRIRLRGTLYRMVREQDADSLLSTGASFAFGGRYNQPKEFGALYLGESPDLE